MKKTKDLFSDKDKEVFKWIAGVFLVWRLLLLLTAFIGVKFFPLKEGYLGGGTEEFLKSPLLWSWANFDGVHYLSIAERGYVQFEQAFFPFYPHFVRFLASLLSENYLVSGLIVSHVSFLAALFFFYKLVRLDFSEKIARQALLFLLLFPTSFYFGSVYTESLFLALTLGAFYSARRRWWGLVGILGAFASATRVIGIFLFPALLVEWYKGSGKEVKQRIKSFLPLVFITLGLIVYMVYLKKTTGDPFYFFHALSAYGTQRGEGKLILLYQVFWRYLKMILTTKLDVLYFAVWSELLASVLFLALLVLVFFRLRFSYFLYMVFAFIMPTLTGSFSSMPRYVLVLFPGFILLAWLAERHRLLKIIYPFLAMVLAVFSVILFTRGYWVA